MKEFKEKYFKYVVLVAVLLIPFMYSFFYLKAYWDPYGEGNIDNLPVAIVNSDKGNKGDVLVQSIKNSKKLKISVVSKEKAEDGLDNKNYYAVITIPDDFTSSMESAATNKKRHATITYSPNQKSNYLASQIINSVVTAVEKNLDNQVNSEIVKSLSENVESVPENLDTISDGFSKLKDGTSKLEDGSKELSSGTSTLKGGAESLKSGISSLESGTSELKNGSEMLNSKYQEFHQGIKSVKDGTDMLRGATSSFGEVGSKIDSLTTGVSSLKTGSDQLHLAMIQIEQICNNVNASSTVVEQQLCGALFTGVDGKGGLNAGITSLNQGLTYLESQTNNLNYLKGQIGQLQSGITSLAGGVDTLYNGSLQIQYGIHSIYEGANKLHNGALLLSNGARTLNDGATKLNTGATTLTNGVTTLNSSVASAKEELDHKITATKKEVKKVESLADYSKEPVKVKTKEVNKVSSYGTAFSPFFISIALWVGCLMMYIVLYYDKEERFAIFGMKNKNLLQRTLAYHGLVTISAIVLGILLQLFLDFEITNVFLYYIVIILTANTFMAIIEFLIINLGDVGKFIALILLVLQLAAAGGTFPIETVTKGFRFLNDLLPMKYTINIIREALIRIESGLLVPNMLIVIGIFIVFFVINIINDIRKNKKLAK